MQPILSASTPDQLAQGLDLLCRGDFVALDTEFMRESTYYPVLCLIQAATPESCVVIDPLAASLSGGDKLQPLWEFLADRKRLKVLHAARQDLEVISQAMRSLDAAPVSIPGPIFDTQVAAGLLGHAAQVGYGGLVTQRLGLTLEKGHARTDWGKRPCPPNNWRTQPTTCATWHLCISTCAPRSKPRAGWNGCARKRVNWKIPACTAPSRRMHGAG